MAITSENRKQKTETGKKTEAGFALLIAVIFMSVMLAIGLALSSLSYKQQVLASGAIQSQYAFYAADAGLECALHGDQKLGTFDIVGGRMSLDCDGQSFSISSTTVGSDVVSTAQLALYNNTRCADVTVYKPSSGVGTTYLFSLGYDVSCATVASPSEARFVARGINARF
jgi:hypothetical protein